MKKVLYIFLIIICLQIVFCTNKIYSTSEIISSQADMLNISEFLNTSESASQDIFEDINFKDIFKNLISGKIEFKDFFKEGINLFKKEFLGILQIIITIFGVVIIHSIFKTICENLGNESCGKIAYFVQYIVIIIFIMQTFSKSITYIKEVIDRLVDYTYVFLPLLMTLMVSTRTFYISK